MRSKAETARETTGCLRAPERVEAAVHSTQDLVRYERLRQEAKQYFRAIQGYRWHRLKPLSEGHRPRPAPPSKPSGGSGPARLPSSAPPRSATRAANIAANGSSQISLTRALPISPLGAMARSPCAWAGASAPSPGALPSFLPHLRSRWQPASPESPLRPSPMTRTEILTRYRQLRQISKEHHRSVLDIIAPDVVLDWARRLGLMRGRTVILESELEMTLAEDLATYLPRPGRSHPLDRYARAARFVPGSDEAIVLEAMHHACFSLWRVERRHEVAGLVLRDLLRGGGIRLVDEAMEKNTPLGVDMAARLLRLEGFAMTARIVVPLIPDLTEQVFDRGPALRCSHGDGLARDPRFAIGIYRAAVATGAMDSVRLKRT